MHGRAVRQAAMQMLADGCSLSAVAAELGIARSTITSWRDAGVDPVRRRPCFACAGEPPAAAGAYAALLGYYLGDGYVSRQRSTYSLRVSCDSAYPGIIEDVSRLVVEVRGPGPVGHVRAPGCIVVVGYWNHWPCVFPQHGPGRKHERAMALTDWQLDAVRSHPADFLRGLFHSDGCRVANWTSHRVEGTPRIYEYARWQFVNHSEEIRAWCTFALDVLGIPWRASSWKTISVSRRAGVEALDRLIGLKS